MQREVRVELLPPSHFTLVPPSTFQPAQPRSAGAPNCEPRALAPAGTIHTESNAGRTTYYSGSAASLPRVNTTTCSSSRPTPTENVATVKQHGRRQADARSYVGSPTPCLQSKPLTEGPRGKGYDGQLQWLPVDPPPQQSRSQTSSQRDSAIRQQHFSAAQSAGLWKGNLRSASIDGRTSIERGTAVGGKLRVRDNGEEAFARSLALCQKIDKSLHFYGDVRKKWSEGPTTAASSPLNNSTRTDSYRTTEVAVPPHTCASGNRAPPISRKIERRPSKEATYHPQRTYNIPSSGHKGWEDPAKSRRRHPQSKELANSGIGAGLNDLSGLPPSRDWGKTTTGASKRPPTLTLTPHSAASPRAESRSGNLLPGPHTPAKHITGPEKRTQTARVILPGPVSHPLVGSRTKLKTAEDKSTQSSIATTNSPATEGSEGDNEKEEFNDFDGIQQDSDCESIEPLMGAFGEPVITGAQPIPSPLLPSRSTELVLCPEPIVSRQSSREPDSVVRKKQPTCTHNDIVIARVLQAEEESRAGVSVTPNTSNDLAIARQIQQDLNRFSPVEKPPLNPPGAMGRGPPAAPRQYTMTPVLGGNEGLEEEGEGRIDFQLIEMMTHQYEYKEQQQQQGAKDPPATECAICLGPFQARDALRLMPCSHTFHRFCVDKWLEGNMSCPVCKADYRSLAEKMGLDHRKYRRRYL